MPAESNPPPRGLLPPTSIPCPAGSAAPEPVATPLPLRSCSPPWGNIEGPDPPQYPGVGVFLPSLAPVAPRQPFPWPKRAAVPRSWLSPHPFFLWGPAGASRQQAGIGLGRRQSAFSLRICLLNVGSPDTSCGGYTDNFSAWIHCQVHASRRAGLGGAGRCGVKEETRQDKSHLSLKKGIDPFKCFFSKGSKLM